MYPAMSITSSFDFFSAHDILIILLMYHISAASSLFFFVFCQCPAFKSIQKNGPYVGFQRVDFGVNFDISVVEDELYLGECVFRQSYFFFISVSHLASGVIVKPRYLKVSTCFILSPLQRILHTGMSDCFEMTMHPVSNPHCLISHDKKASNLLCMNPY